MYNLYYKSNEDWLFFNNYDDYCSAFLNYKLIGEMLGYSNVVIEK